MDARDQALTAIFTGLYAILVMVLAPISFGPVQLRVADCLIPLAALFGWPVVAGVTVGCFLGNAYYWLGPYDVVFGPVANLIAASAIFLLRKRRLLACVVGALPIGVIVGGYLWLFFTPPDVFGLSLPAWAAMMISITISSLIATAVIGYSLLTVLGRQSIVEPLKSRGLKVVTES
ncbi:MAG: QueT transporter family protein [Candidatus Bathyarchaeota archaeon]|nr:QueT transporter family protein [Candidatus Bathyarchaeota archaeon]MDH5531966.1 QueT transporter family protein [Candidatus Bathyarchaeota archaeon]MDH5713863.1 QueT transporter family protein [Candidatus Bathyarchaeota archaeon]